MSEDLPPHGLYRGIRLKTSDKGHDTYHENGRFSGIGTLNQPSHECFGYLLQITNDMNSCKSYPLVRIEGAMSEK